MLDKLKINLDRKPKEAFYASDFGKPALDLYFSFLGEPQTNPPKWNDTLKWGAGNGVEAQFGKILKDSGIVDPDYDQKKNGRVEIDLGGVWVHGYIDFITKTGYPIECKSINNKNDWDIRKYKDDMPRESYVGQLAIYMEFLKKKTGLLFVSSIDGLHYFSLKCRSLGSGRYKCGKVTVDVHQEFAKWKKLWEDHIVPKKMPDIWEYRYKYDLKTINWRELSPSKISDMRNGHVVLGDYQVSWSPWKNKIIKLQGERLGYSNDELDFIKEQTEGYTTWKKQK